MQIIPITNVIDEIATLEANLKEQISLLPADKAVEVIDDLITDLEALHDIIVANP